MEKQCQYGYDLSSTDPTQAVVEAKAVNPLVAITMATQECVKGLTSSPHCVNNYVSTLVDQVINSESDFVNRMHVSAGRSVITNFYPNSEEIIIPDELSPFQMHENLEHITKQIPTIRIKGLEQLQDPLSFKKPEQINLQKVDELNNQYDQSHFADVQSQLANNNIEIIEGYQFPNSIKSVSDLVGSEVQRSYKICVLNSPIHKKTERDLKLEKKEKLLKERLMKLNEKKELLFGAKSGKNKCKKLLSDTGEYSNTSKTNANWPKLQISNSTNINPVLITSEPETNEQVVENKQQDEASNSLVNSSTEKVDKETDLTGLKEGIIEASHSLINTQRTLKILAQIVSGNESLKNQQAVMFITKFQNVLKSFRRKIDGIDKTVKNQYKDLIPQTINMDSILKSIQEENKMKTLKHFKQHQTKETLVYEVLSNPTNFLPRKETVEYIGRPRTELPNICNSDEVNKSNIGGQELNDLSFRDIRQENSEDKKTTRKVKFRVVPNYNYKYKKRKLTRFLSKKCVDEEELSDVSFKIPGSFAVTSSAPLRVTPRRSCRQTKSYNFIDDEQFDYENS